MKRSLSLRREVLDELGVDELTEVVGAQELSGLVSCPIRNCLINTELICMQYTWAC